jgi:hypothetical protein
LRKGFFAVACHSSGAKARRENDGIYLPFAESSTRNAYGNRASSLLVRGCINSRITLMAVTAKIAKQTMSPHSRGLSLARLYMGSCKK